MLVSVIVITYNSSKYVLQTLDSIYRQDYKDIELIISDDCSRDNTVELCKEWIQQKGQARFVESKVISTQQNSGICANYNNGLKFAKGQWIKYIAGDDYLTLDCISSFVNATQHSANKIFICGTLPFTAEEDLSPRLPLWIENCRNAKEQGKYILKHGTVIEGPTLFLETDTLRKFDGFEERYPFIEDYPLYMKYLLNGYQIGFVNKCLIHYREYPESVSRSNSKFSESIFAAIDYYAPRLSKKMTCYYGGIIIA